MKYSPIILFFLCLSHLGWGQQSKYEQEYRITQELFPQKAYALLSEYLDRAKRIRFYKEIDSTKESYEAKFKKGRLRYSVEFDIDGTLEDVEFIIKKDDVPEETWHNILSYLDTHFPKFRLRKIQQQHPLVHQDPKKTLHDAFQNLILPHVNYELVFSAKKEKRFQTYEALFNSEGKLVKLQKSFPPSYDHIQY